MTRKMKDSGVKWIGKIPETWLILHLKYVCDLKTGGTPANKIGIDVEGEIPWITAQDMIDAGNMFMKAMEDMSKADKKIRTQGFDSLMAD